MAVLWDCIQNYATIFVGINFLEFVAGLLLCLIPLKKAWQEYLVCVYGGFLFGMVPAFYISESILCMLGSSVMLAVVLCWLQYFYRKKVYLPLLIIFMKMTLIAGGIFLYVTDSEQSIEFFILAMVLALIAYVSTNFVIVPTAIQSHIILALFGVTEIVGAVLQFYRMDYSAFQKYGKEGALGFFLYILKVDYSIFDYQYLFVIGLFATLIGYFAWKKIFEAVRENCGKGKTRETCKR